MSPYRRRFLPTLKRKKPELPGLPTKSERFQAVIAKLKLDYALDPEIMAEIEAIAKKLENEK